MELEVLEHEFNAAPFPIFCVGEAVTTRWKPHLGRNVDVFAMDLDGTKLRWILSMDSWNACADALFDVFSKDPDSFWILEKNVRRTVSELWDFAKDWKTRDFSACAHPELFSLYAGFLQRLRTTFEYGVLLSIADFNPPKLTLHLQAIAQKRFGENANAAFTTLTTNVDEHTYQKDEELDFLRILALPESRRPDAIREHAERFGFLSYGYRGPVTWTEAYFAELVAASATPGLGPAQKLKQHEYDAQKTREAIHVLESKLSDEEKKWFSIGRKLVFLKPWRKESQIRTYPLAERLLREIAKRLDVPLEATKYLTEDEMKTALLDGRVDVDELMARKKRCFVLSQNGRTAIYSGERAEAWSAQVKPEEIPDVQFLSGTPATVGHVKGTVCIVNAPEDIAKMKEGFILLSVATNPFLMPAIKKAAAIVTDQGGLTCHAAIVSREFNIPCVVGTRHATRIFKDGDSIEVDAKLGIVKKV
ncbi:hypothetical protein HY572_03060 [Candidatus Micrarchaeota archaeon]|nr:hypothetical protein [Candidatus Micrarchaeota archaeon]